MQYAAGRDRTRQQFIPSFFGDWLGIYRGVDIEQKMLSEAVMLDS